MSFAKHIAGVRITNLFATLSRKFSAAAWNSIRISVPAWCLYGVFSPFFVFGLSLLCVFFLPVLLLFRYEDAIRGRVYMWLPCWSNYVQLLQSDQMRTNYSAQIQVIKYLAFN